MKKLQFLSFAVLLLTATSCLKDSVNQPNPTQGGSENEVKGVYFSKGKGPYLAGVKSAVELSSLPQPLMFTVGLAASTLQASSVDFNMALSNEAANKLRDTLIAQGLDPANVEVLDPSLITLPASGTVDAGSWADSVEVILNTSALNAENVYVFAINLTGASNGFQAATGGLGTLAFQLSVKNRLDGVYSIRGHHNRAPYDLSYQDVAGDPSELLMDMITTGPNSVVYYWQAGGDFGHPIGLTSGLSWYGDFAPEITFNVDNDMVSVVNFVAPGSPVMGVFNNPSYNTFPSRFDPSDHSIYACFNYNNNPLRGFYDTLTYIGPRP